MIGAWSANHRWLVVGAWLAIVVIALFALSRQRFAGTIGDMLGNETPAARAMTRLMEQYAMADELLLVVTVPDGMHDDQATIALHEFVERLAAHIQANRSVAPMVERITFRRDPAVMDFVRDHVLPAVLFMIDEATLHAMLARLQPESMRTQLARHETLVATPGAAGEALSEALSRDPLRLLELVNTTTVGGFSDASKDFAHANEGPPLELSVDGRSLLVRIRGAAPSSDLAFAKALSGSIKQAVNRVNSGGLRVELAGGYAVASETSRGMRADAIRSTIVAIVLVQVIFLSLYGRLFVPLLISAVAATGIVAGFGVHALLGREITPLTAVIAALLAGLGVDYGVHFMSHYRVDRSEVHGAADASRATMEAVGIPVATNCFTSIFGFASLWPSKIAMLSDFAVLGALGLLGALATVGTLMPAILAFSRSRGLVERGGVSTTWLVDAIARRRGVWLAASICLGVVAAGMWGSRGFGLPMEADLTVLHPRPNRALDATHALQARFPHAAETLPIELRASDGESLLIAAHEVAQALNTRACRDAGVSRVMGLHSLLPDPRERGWREALLASIDADAVLRDFDGAVDASIFQPHAFSRGRETLAALLRPQSPPTIETVLQSPGLAALFFPLSDIESRREPTCTVLAVGLSTPLIDRTQRDRLVCTVRGALAGIPEATLTGTAVVGHDLEMIATADLPRSMALSSLLVCSWLFLVFRRIVLVLLALAPLLFAMLAVMGWISATGGSLNPVSGVALPLLNGIAVDAGVFLVSAAGGMGTGMLLWRKRLESTIHAILVASTTTIAGFGALCFATTPAIRSLGFLAALGAAGALAGALLFILPILLFRARWRAAT